MDYRPWIALGGFQLFINHFGEVKRKSDVEYVITLEKHFSMDKNYNFAPNETGEENNPAEFNLPGLGPLYFPDEWAHEFETQGDAKRFLVSGAWKRTEEIRVFDYNCDGNWADGFLHSWAIVKRVRPMNPYVSPTINYQVLNYNWIYGDLWIVNTQYPRATRLIPTN